MLNDYEFVYFLELTQDYIWSKKKNSFLQSYRLAYLSTHRLHHW